MTITAKKLAEICGVSRGTIDRALKGRDGINEETRHTVLEMAKKHGYRPNFIGQALSSGKTMTIGIIVFDFVHGFFAELFSAFEQEASHYNYITFPMLSYQNPEREKECIRHLTDRNVDGIILLPVNESKSFERELLALNIPLVCIGNRLSEKIPFVGIDDFAAASDAVRYYQQQHIEHIFYFCPPLRKQQTTNMYAQKQRLAGYEAMMRELKLDGRYVTDSNDLIGLLKKTPKNTAVICSSDFYALDLQKQFRQEEPELYENVQIMGFDGLRELKYAVPAIQTVSFSKAEYAKSAFEQIYSQLGGAHGSDILVPHVVLESDRI